MQKSHSPLSVPCDTHNSFCFSLTEWRRTWGQSQPGRTTTNSKDCPLHVVSLVWSSETPTWCSFTLIFAYLTSSQVHAGPGGYAWLQAILLLLLHVEVRVAGCPHCAHRRHCHWDGRQSRGIQCLGGGWGQCLVCLVYVFTEGKTDLPFLLFHLCHSLLPHPCALFLQGAERFHSYPPWALAMAYALIVVAMLPLPMVYIARHFNLISDGSNKLSVSYRKGMMKDMSNLEEQDEQRFILSKNPSEAPSPMPAHRAYLGPGGTQEMTNTNYGTSTKTGYQNIGSPESELWFTELIDPPPNKPQPCLERGREMKKGRNRGHQKGEKIHYWLLQCSSHLNPQSWVPLSPLFCSIACDSSFMYHRKIHAANFLSFPAVMMGSWDCETHLIWQPFSIC